MARVIVLVHAPVLGPGSWAGVAHELSHAGNRVVAPSLAGFADGGAPFTPRLVSRVAGQVRCGDGDDVVLAVHSGAGVFVPHLVLALGGGDATAVFVDAALPRQADPGTVVDAGFLPYLRELAIGGVVPPWPQWWPGEDLAPLFPDEAARQAVTSQAQPLPFAFFEELVPVLPDGWPSCRAAYLAFSEPYRRQAGEAAQAGWPVRELPGEHLHMLVDPRAVAAAIMGLAGQARSAGSSLRSLP
jgi:hypothetical protein